MSKHPDLVPMESSLIAGYHYDPPTNRLTVKFKNGDVWQYDDVPHERAEAFAGNASPGAFFGKKIKGQYPGRKL